MSSIFHPLGLKESKWRALWPEHRHFHAVCACVLSRFSCAVAELQKQCLKASLLVQRLRICQPMHEIRVRSLVREGSMCPRSNGTPVPQSPRATPTETRAPQEKPLRWEARALQLESSPHSLKLEKARTQQHRSSAAKNKYSFFKNS